MEILSLLNAMVLSEQARTLITHSLAMAAMGSCNPGGIVLLTAPGLAETGQRDITKKSCWTLKKSVGYANFQR